MNQESTNLSKRIIPCLDVKDGRVVKGIKFKNHVDHGDIIELAQFYKNEGADELVFYDITASSSGRVVDVSWIKKLAYYLDIPFCVAGGINSVAKARDIFNAGADKISINSPAILRPQLINELKEEFGSQAIVVGIDSSNVSGDYHIWKFTGDPNTAKQEPKLTMEWIEEVQWRGAGEIVLNCMDSDGTRAGFDIDQLQRARPICHVPLIASGGAGTVGDFEQVFNRANVDGGLAAGISHRKEISIGQLKNHLSNNSIKVRNPGR